MDNHNHALYFWTTDIKTKMKRKEENQDKMKNNAISLIHIDQHSDLNSPESRLSLPEVSDQKSSDSTLREYTNNVCQISTFITPFLERFPQTEFTRIKSEYDLLEN